MGAWTRPRRSGGTATGIAPLAYRPADLWTNTIADGDYLCGIVFTPHAPLAMYGVEFPYVGAPKTWKGGLIGADNVDRAVATLSITGTGIQSILFAEDYIFDEEEEVGLEFFAGVKQLDGHGFLFTGQSDPAHWPTASKPFAAGVTTATPFSAGPYVTISALRAYRAGWGFANTRGDSDNIFAVTPLFRDYTP